MPYLKEEDRNSLAHDCYQNCSNAGELNFCITRIIDRFLNYKGLKYSSINEAIGALECAKLELYRRIAGPYEDTKVISNGDVYTIGVPIVNENL